ncbi:hypothetical protein CNE_1c13590 [Cupriavidus necator N-1]|uniref:Holin n=1 Tax=Cupriavidus necator (strain ATCC 43291 / DSM 13513 / CCUG 52238 / LMG 8453 / N-1) TaxID=1042878 RepID=G0ES90_CUPNN|nr:hypothetical protein [Cupriavidus necator]AEI76708.1 hypothetical protein CNE_1c13590 [Cupriavidus necator N-1]MDX6014718.1 hypothetical protein [Cupriavidus necator]
MELIEEAKKQFPRLWSVRLSLLAGFLSSLEAGADMYLTGKPAMAAIAAALVAFAAAFSRIVAQPALKDLIDADKGAAE